MKSNFLQTRALDMRHFVKDFKRQGYVKVHSPTSGHAIYIVKNSEVAKLVPDKSIPIFLEKDLEALTGNIGGDYEKCGPIYDFTH